MSLRLAGQLYFGHWHGSTPTTFPERSRIWSCLLLHCIPCNREIRNPGRRRCPSVLYIFRSVTAITGCACQFPFAGIYIWVRVLFPVSTLTISATNTPPDLQCLQFIQELVVLPLARFTGISHWLSCCGCVFFFVGKKTRSREILPSKDLLLAMVAVAELFAEADRCTRTGSCFFLVSSCKISQKRWRPRIWSLFQW